MSRRMTDTNKWDDEWFMNLSPRTKLLWFFLCDECDHAGIWKVNRTLTEFKVGGKINWDESLAELGGRVAILPPGDRWFVRKFVEFQYGPVPNEKNKAHAGVLKVLRLHGLPWSSDDPNKPLPSPYGGAKEKEREKDMDSSRESAEREPDPAEVRAAHEAIFKRLLLRLVVADGAKATRKWWALANTGPSILTFEQKCDRLEWLVTVARKRGIVVNYASDVMPIVSEWGPKPRGAA